MRKWVAKFGGPEKLPGHSSGFHGTSVATGSRPATTTHVYVISELAIFLFDASKALFAKS